MTREEAIEIIRKEYACVDADCDIERSCGKCELHMPSKEPILKAYEMAIQALSQEPCDVFDKYGNYKYPSDVELTEPNTATSMPCEDAISREAAINIASLHCLTIDETVKALEQLPSVTQKSETVTEFADRCRECGAKYGKLLKQKSGKWIGIDEEPHEDYECSYCGYVVSTFTANIEPHTEYKYCPNCGCRMVEPQESEDKE